MVVFTHWNFAESMVLGDDVEETLSSCVKFDSGVDAQNSIILKYKMDRWLLYKAVHLPVQNNMV